jgi:hypothetical protein
VIYVIIDGALAAGLWFYGVAKLRAGDLQTAKTVALVVGIIVGVLSLLALGRAASAVDVLLALIGLATGGGLVYAAMLVSPGRKLF